jgi:hypothetical protein
MSNFIYGNVFTAVRGDHPAHRTLYEVYGDVNADIVAKTFLIITMDQTVVTETLQARHSYYEYYPKVFHFWDRRTMF